MAHDTTNTERRTERSQQKMGDTTRQTCNKSHRAINKEHEAKDMKQATPNTEQDEANAKQKTENGFVQTGQPNDDMKVITVMTRKGGAGKTTLVQALISAALKDGKRILALDADPQQGLHRWLKPLSEKEPLITSRQLEYAADLERWTEDAYEAGSVDLVFVDTQGAAGEWADELAAHSDFLVVPMKMADKDLSITTDTFNWYVGLRDRVDDPDLLPTLRIIIADVPRDMNATQKKIEMIAIERFPIMNNYFMHRKQHLDADTNGFLHVQAEEKRNGRFGLGRTHAKHFDEAVEEARDILAEITGDK
jgi:chromosome partitioning protein